MIEKIFQFWYVKWKPRPSGYIKRGKGGNFYNQNAKEEMEG